MKTSGTPSFMYGLRSFSCTSGRRHCQMSAIISAVCFPKRETMIVPVSLNNIAGNNKGCNFLKVDFTDNSQR